jgi:glycine/sarcosine N-methyltransferase
MDHMIDAGSAGIQGVEEFYDRLAADYDAMTTFEKRFIQEEPFFRLLVQRHRLSSALDAGCGTGFHSILLSRLGVRVTAVDISSRMLIELAQHAASLGLDIRTMRAQLVDLPGGLNGSFDGIFCMGNTLAHLLTKQELHAALDAFARLLVPGGLLFLQVLNYDRILLTRPEIQSVKETDRGTFTRSYDYAGETIHFTIRKDPIVQGEEGRVQSVTLRPVLSAELCELLADSGFDDVHPFGSVAMEEFDPATSRDFVVLARRTPV